MFYWGAENKNTVIKKIPHSQQIYLTFDDGPDENQTPPILDLLAQLNVKASFFVIGTKARKNSFLLKRMKDEGHRIFSHSIDHNYHNYFSNEKKIKNWLQNSLDDLADLTGEHSSVFRPPAGVLTPPLIQAAQELNIHLLLWNHRFYDALWPFYQWHCQWRLTQMKSGDIILLHDKQKTSNYQKFMSTLTFLLESLSQRQFRLSSLNEKEF